MFFSPNPTHKLQKSLTNQLNKYLPNSQRSQQQKQQALYIKFSTIQQISKSIQIEKQKIDQQVYEFNQKINHCNNVISKRKKDCSQLKQKIQNLKFVDSIQQSHFTVSQEFPKIPLHNIGYTLNQKPKYSSKQVKKQEIYILSSQIEKLQKQCAKLYCNENQKFQQFSINLFQQFDKLSTKLSKRTNKSQQAVLQLRIMKDQQKFKQKVKHWQKQLNQKFEQKILKLLQKMQTKM